MGNCTAVRLVIKNYFRSSYFSQLVVSVKVECLLQVVPENHVDPVIFAPNVQTMAACFDIGELNYCKITRRDLTTPPYQAIKG